LIVTVCAIKDSYFKTVNAQRQDKDKILKTADKDCYQRQKTAQKTKTKTKDKAFRKVIKRQHVDKDKDSYKDRQLGISISY
jgi:hypothetical protein